MGARMLEDIIQRDYGVKISHNKIHRYMRRDGMASGNRKKQQKRRWVRWERQHSMSLWHTDYKWLSSLEKWIIAYQDDASRHVMGHALVDAETAGNAVQLLDDCIQQWGTPREVLTDQGTQFCAAGGEKKQKGLSRFERHCRELDIRHIVGRVSHPQTNGKIERLYRTLEEKLPLFKYDMGQTVHWYNHVKPHMSLIFHGHYDTPHKAFYRKLPPERIMQYANEWLWNGIA